MFKEQEEDERRLDEEFLPDDAARRVAQDFGQSRVINQRITLTVPFQLLDPSQLTEAVQRRITLMVRDQLRELEQTQGGVIG
jgi:hypothetical protein